MDTKRQHLLDTIRAAAHAVALNEYAATGRSAATLDIEDCPTVARLVADYPSAARLLGSYEDAFVRGAAARAAEEGFAAGEAAARAQDVVARRAVPSPTSISVFSAASGLRSRGRRGGRPPGTTRPASARARPA